jgi:hypothetical protein
MREGSLPNLHQASKLASSTRLPSCSAVLSTDKQRGTCLTFFYLKKTCLTFDPRRRGLSVIASSGNRHRGGGTDAIRGRHDSLHAGKEEEGRPQHGHHCILQLQVPPCALPLPGRAGAAFCARLVRSSSLRSILLLFRSQGGGRSWRAAPCLPRCGLLCCVCHSPSTVVLRAAVVLHGVSLDREEGIANY